MNEIGNGIYYVGIQNQKLRRFDVVLHTDYGTTYNSYVVKGKDKIALIETAKDKFSEEYLRKVQEVCPLEDIDYIILQHMEPDHTGSLQEILKKATKAEVITTKSGSLLVQEILNEKLECRVIKTGDSVDLGGKTLEFMEAPFLHWPDTMFTYLREEKTLFPCDFLGCHYGEEVITCSLSPSELERIQKYYFDVIMSPFKTHVLNALDKIKDLELELVAPSHGPVLRGPLIATTKERFYEWSKDILDKNAKPQVYIAYMSCYGYTEQLGRSIEEGLSSQGIECKLVDVADKDADKVARELEKADGVALGCSTINRDAIYLMWEILARLNPYVLRGKKSIVFGSYGWSGEACKYMEERLTNLGFKNVGTVRAKLKPDETNLKEAVDLGVLLGKELKA